MADEMDGMHDIVDMVRTVDLGDPVVLKNRGEVNLNRRLEPRKQTWKYLKKALLRRYGERLDKSVAEWRVNSRVMMHSRVMMSDETYADFAAGLRQAAGRNHVSERVFLAQFYRCLDKTTRKLVLQRQKPKTLEKGC
ncbi:hypothetical protein PHMEG_00024327 [Phytophthora megakarya]|uniref:Uncharacterized protein n=1 Tax=Phytophthora megakarya TaxID=4795 RepID=A0A225VDZ2_9STRA|nr:hypothetical protein PHMEG_00024327 [Phytophthora megakarya]